MKPPRNLLPMLTVSVAAGAVMLPAWAGPLGWLPVLLHESAHGVVALATGAREVQISLTPDGGGSTRAAGGVPTLVWGAGYLGAPLVGLGMSRLSRRWPGAALATLALVTAAASVAWLPTGNAIGMGLLGTAGLLGGLSIGLSDERATRLEPLVVLYVCAYGLADVVFDAWHAAPHVTSDSAQLAAHWGIPELAVTLAWGIAALLIGRAAMRPPSEPV